MVSLRMMGWGLVLLENSSVAAAAAVTARPPVGAARPPVGAARPPVGPPARPSRPSPQKLGVCIKKYRIWTLFKGCVFRKYIVHIFKILTISQLGHLSKNLDGNLKNEFLVTTFKNDIKKCLHTKVLRRGLDGSWLVGF